MYAYNARIHDCVMYVCAHPSRLNTRHLNSGYVLHKHLDNHEDSSKPLCKTKEYCWNSAGCHIDTSQVSNCNETEDGSVPCLSCDCLPGYTGLNCNQETFCVPNPCINNGVCRVADGSYSCSCADGIYGRHCQIRYSLLGNDNFYRYSVEATILNIDCALDIRSTERSLYKVFDFKTLYKDQVKNKLRKPNDMIIIKLRHIGKGKYILTLIYSTYVMLDYYHVKNVLPDIFRTVYANSVFTANSDPPIVTIDATLFECGFENKDKCDIQGNDWSIISGITRNANTGPNIADDSNYYLYVDSGRVKPGNMVTLRLPTVHLTTNETGFETNVNEIPAKVCLIFSYYIDGMDTGYIEVLHDDLVIYSVGTQSDYWQKARMRVLPSIIPANERRVNVDITIRIKVGHNATSDIGIDNIVLTLDTSRCSGYDINTHKSICPRKRPLPTSECLRAVWADYCKLQFNGVDSNPREFRTGVNIQRMVSMVQPLSVSAYKGDERAVQDCLLDYIELEKLKNGVVGQAGTVTIYKGNKFKYICSGYINEDIANVICKSTYIKLGSGKNSEFKFTGGEQLDLTSNLRQGVPADDILLTNLRCSGRESNLFQCEHILAVDRGVAYPCNSQHFVMVNCTGSTDARVTSRIPSSLRDSSRTIDSDFIQFECTFDEGTLCGMTHTLNSQLSFTLTSMDTPTIGTGPYGAATPPYYVFLEVSGGTPGQYAALRTTLMKASGIQCMSFQYNMNGLNTATLTVYLQPVVRLDMFDVDLPMIWLWNTRGHHGTEWMTFTIKMDLEEQFLTRDKYVAWDTPKDDNHYYIIFNAVVGDGFLGDISLDSIQIDRCNQRNTTTPNPPTPKPPIDQCNEENICNHGNCTSGPNSTFSCACNGKYRGKYCDKVDKIGPYEVYIECRLKLNIDKLFKAFTYQKLKDFFHRNTLELVESNVKELLSSSHMTNISVSVHFDKIISHAQLHDYFEEYLQINSYLFESREITSIYSEVALFQCDFEARFCAMNLDDDVTLNDVIMTNDFEWTLNSDYNHNIQTGPSSELDGRYAIVDSRDRIHKDISTLVADDFDTYEGLVCLRFSYYLYGEEMGYLKVYVNHPEAGHANLLFLEGGYSYDGWQTAHIRVNVTRGMQIILMASIGGDSYSNIAIDNVIMFVNPDLCSEETQCSAYSLVRNSNMKCLERVWKSYCNTDLDENTNPLIRYMLTTTLNGIERYMQTIFTKKAYFYDDYYYSLCFGNVSMLRLADGEAPNEGRVELRIPGNLIDGDNWGTMCSNDLDQTNAAVICQQLGYSKHGALIQRSKTYEHGNTTIYMWNVRCTGNENNVWYCPRATGSKGYCSHSDDLYVACQLNKVSRNDTIGMTPDKDKGTLDMGYNNIYIPSLISPIVYPAKLTAWEAYFYSASKLYFLIVRPVGRSINGKEQYKIIGKTEAISESKKGVYLRIDLTSEPIYILPGDIIAIYFPALNTVGYVNSPCISDEYRLRYEYEPISVNINETHTFDLAPLSMEPCRTYGIKFDLDYDYITPPEKTPDQNYLLYYCGFKSDLCSARIANSNVNTNESTSVINWKRGSSINMQLANGPVNQLNNNQEYAYIITDTYSGGSVSSLVIPTFQAAVEGCVTFAYYFYGRSIGRLSVLLNDAELWNVESSSSHWTRQSINVTFNGTCELRFEMRASSSIDGVVGIDEIYVRSEPCTVIKKLKKKRKEKKGIEHKFFISNIYGNDTISCGKYAFKCRSLKYVLSKSFKTKKLILCDGSEYLLHGDDFNKTIFLTITNDINSKFISVLKFKGKGSLMYLNLNNIKVKGDLLIESETNTDLSLEFEHSTFKRFSLANNYTNILTSNFTNSKFIGCNFNLESISSTIARVVNCSFTGKHSIPGDQVTTGLNFKAMSKGTHVYHLENSSFVEHRVAHFDVALPNAAFTVYVKHKMSLLRITIVNCRFTDNERAVDISMLGEVKILVEGSLFADNVGIGSGGAIRLTMTTHVGFTSLDAMEQCSIVVLNSRFHNNLATTTNRYDKSNIYFQSRSPGNGGAIYVELKLPYVYNSVGLVNVTGCMFLNNSAPIRGGAVFIGPDVSCIVEHSVIHMPLGYHTHSKTGDIIYSTGNITIANVEMNVEDADTSVSLFTYQASTPSKHRLLLLNTSLSCPLTHYVDVVNSSSYGTSHGIESMRIYCRACADEYYSLKQSKVDLNLSNETKSGIITCEKCPYGATCYRGIINNEGFWGTAFYSDAVTMYNCPKDYCVSSTDERISLDSCSPARTGVLCGHCKEGYSESLYSTECVPDEQCAGVYQWRALVVMIGYGILYVLFFMFEPDYEGVIDSLIYKMQASKKKPQPDSSQPVKRKKVTLSETGYLQIFMYYVQTSDLLKLDLIVEVEHNYDYVIRPGDVIPERLTNITQSIFDFEPLAAVADQCIFTGIRPAHKTAFNSLYVLYLFVVLASLYALSGFCCCFVTANRRPRIGAISMNGRVVMTFILLLLYTYQELAENALKMLNCTVVNGRNVLFYDGDIECLQGWQYGVIAAVCVFVVPFFVVLLLGPHLLKKKRIGFVFFMLSFVFPLFLTPAIIYLFVRDYKKDQCDISRSQLIENRPTDRENYDREAAGQEATQGSTVCCGEDEEEMNDLLVDVIFGPYGQAGDVDDNSKLQNGSTMMYGFCWEGFINLRRLVLITVYTFVNDILSKHVLLTATCFVILLLHARVKPFKHAFSNLAESCSLSLLLVVSITNLVKAAFYNSQTSPREVGYLVIVLFEWVELIALVLLPIGITLLLVMSLTVGLYRRMFRKRDKDAGVSPVTRGGDVFRDRNAMPGGGINLYQGAISKRGRDGISAKLRLHLHDDARDDADRGRVHRGHSPRRNRRKYNNDGLNYRIH